VMGFNMLGDGLRDAMDPKISLRNDYDPDDLPVPGRDSEPTVPTGSGDPASPGTNPQQGGDD